MNHFDHNSIIFEKVKEKIISLARDFNKEVLMTLLSIETGIENYAELTEKLN